MDVKLDPIRDASSPNPASAQPPAVDATLSEGISVESFLAAHTEAAKKAGGATGGKCPFSGGARHLGLTAELSAMAEAALRGWKDANDCAR